MKKFLLLFGIIGALTSCTHNPDEDPQLEDYLDPDWVPTVVVNEDDTPVITTGVLTAIADELDEFAINLIDAQGEMIDFEITNDYNTGKGIWTGNIDNSYIDVGITLDVGAYVGEYRVRKGDLFAAGTVDIVITPGSYRNLLSLDGEIYQSLFD